MLWTTIPLQRYINPLIIFSLIVFLFTYYDTTHAHVLTSALNEWILQTLYVSPTVTEKSQHYYYEILRCCSALGGTIIFIILSVIILAGLIYKKAFKIIYYCAAFAIIMFAIAGFLKLFVDSPRPMIPLEHDSFPSGHAIRISIICAVLWWLNQLRLFYLPNYAKIVFFIVPLLVGYARVGLGFHWVSDVLAAYAITVIILSWVSVIFSALIEKKGENPG